MSWQLRPGSLVCRERGYSRHGFRGHNSLLIGRIVGQEYSWRNSGEWTDSGSGFQCTGSNRRALSASRMFTVPFAGIWLTFWAMQTAEAMGVSNRIHLLIVAMVAVAVATVITVTIPYTIEDRRKKTGRA